MVCDISVEFKVSRHTYSALKLMASQNGEVGLTLNVDGTITLSAQMLDFTNSEYTWPEKN